MFVCGCIAAGAVLVLEDVKLLMNGAWENRVSRTGVWYGKNYSTNAEKEEGE